MRRRKILVFLGGLLLLAAAAIAWMQTPSYALFRIARAIENKDAATFREYVNVDRIVGGALDDLMAAQLEKKQGGLLDLLGTQIQGSLLSLLTPMVSALVNREIDRALAPEAVSEATPLPPAGPPGSSDIMGQLGKLKNLSREPGQTQLAYLNRNGTTAQLGIKVRHEGMQKDFLLNFVMEKNERWELVRLSNLLFILSELTAGEWSLLEKRNQAIRETMEKSLQLGPLVQTHESYGFGLVERTRFRLAVKNLSASALTYIEMALLRKSDKDLSPGLLSLSEDLRLAPGEETTLEFSSELAFPGRNSANLKDLKTEDLRVLITQLVLEDGTKHQLLRDPGEIPPAP